jgi:hypothetical protein
MYLHGARLEAFYPVSVPFQGQSLNITCITYDGQFNIGFTGGRDSLPSLQRIAVYSGEALQELEEAIAVEKPKSSARRASQRGTRKS